MQILQRSDIQGPRFYRFHTAEAPTLSVYSTLSSATEALIVITILGYGPTRPTHTDGRIDSNARQHICTFNLSNGHKRDSRGQSSSLMSRSSSIKILSET